MPFSFTSHLYLQGFPDYFVFLGTRGDIRSEIGNAVPPPLAEAIGREIRHSLMIADGVATELPTGNAALPPRRAGPRDPRGKPGDSTRGRGLHVNRALFRHDRAA